MDLARMRQEYETRGLQESDVVADAVAQFKAWLGEAIAAGVGEPNAMVLSTVDADGAPSARNVLLKGISAGGFEFYTSYASAKGYDMASNPRVALTFSWLGLHRQVRIAGHAAKLTAAESDAYFALRPLGSQMGAVASPQSKVIADRETLEARVAAIEEAHDTAAAVPRPADWGGYRVTPTMIELWQGRSNRLHDRLRYRREDPGWSIERLAP